MGKDWSKAAPLTGVLFAVLAASGAVTEGSTPSATASGSTVTAFYVAHQHRQQLAAVLLAFAFIVLVCFAATLRAQLRRPNGRDSLATLALIGAAVLAVGQTTTAGCSWALAADPGKLTTATAQTLNLAGNDLVLTSAAGWFIFNVAAGLAIFATKALPRWLAWASILIGVVAVTPAEFVAFLALVIWSLVTAALLWRRNPPPATTEPTLPTQSPSARQSADAAGTAT